jgi:hypothetical protein
MRKNDLSDMASALGKQARGKPKRITEQERERRRENMRKVSRERWASGVPVKPTREKAMPQRHYLDATYKGDFVRVGVAIALDEPTKVAWRSLARSGVRLDGKTDKLPRLTDAMADWPAEAQAEVLS